MNERTVVAQAGQIKRLQKALREADKDAYWSSISRVTNATSLDYEEPCWADYGLLPDDMEATNE